MGAPPGAAQPAPRFSAGWGEPHIFPAQIGVHTTSGQERRYPRRSPQHPEGEVRDPTGAQPRGRPRTPAGEGGVRPPSPGPEPNASWPRDPPGDGLGPPSRRGGRGGERGKRERVSRQPRREGDAQGWGLPEARCPWSSIGRTRVRLGSGRLPRPRAPRPPRPGRRAARTWAAGRRRALRQRARPAPRSLGKCGGDPGGCTKLGVPAGARPGPACGSGGRRQEVFRRPRAPLTWTFSGLAQHRPHRGAGRAGEARRAG